MTVPYGDTPPKRARAPFSDEIARAVVDEDNLRRLADLDANRRGLRDIWETIVATGRRGGEVVSLRLDLSGPLRRSAHALARPDQGRQLRPGHTHPETVYQRLQARQDTTVKAFSDRHGRLPTAKERTRMALFPGTRANPDGRRPLSYGWF